MIMSLIGPYLSGHNYAEQNLERANMAPRIPGLLSGEEKLSGTEGQILVNRYEDLGLQDVYYPFGTDGLGRDFFSRCFQGLRVSVLIALAAALIDLVIGVNYGMISGYLGGKTDLIMQQIVDIAGSIPSLVIVTLLMLVLKPGVGTIIFALRAFEIAFFEQLVIHFGILFPRLLFPLLLIHDFRTLFAAFSSKRSFRTTAL